jgi:hypothetical protein
MAALRRGQSEAALLLDCRLSSFPGRTSVARGEATEDSDVDFLVSTSASVSPWLPAGLVVDLEDLLGCRVQVVTEEGLHWLRREKILREARPL